MEYLRTGLRPFNLIDTGLTGLTTYPFANKWAGFDYLSPWVGRGLAASAVIGLGLFLGSPTGRLLLVVLVTSLVPYAFTWPVPGGAEWRFTMHALPFYLIAAFFTLDRAARLVDQDAMSRGARSVAARAPAAARHRGGRGGGARARRVGGAGACARSATSASGSRCARASRRSSPRVRGTVSSSAADGAPLGAAGSSPCGARSAARRSCGFRSTAGATAG